MNDTNDTAKADDSTVADSGADSNDGFDSAFVGDSYEATGGVIDDEPATEAVADEPPKDEAPADEVKADEPAKPDKAEAQPEVTQVPLPALQESREVIKQQREQIAQLMQIVQGNQPKDDAPADPLASLDFIDDPQGSAAALQQFVSKQLQQQRDELTRGFQGTLHGIMEQQVRSAHEDYDDATAAFEQAVKEKPALLEQFRSARNPAQFAYEAGRNYKLLNELGTNDLPTLIQKVRAQGEAAGRAALEAEISKTTQAVPKSGASTLESLNTLAGAQSANAGKTDSDDLGTDMSSHFL